MSTFGKRENKSADCFEASAEELLPLVEEKRRALSSYKNLSSQRILQALRTARSRVQQTARRSANDYWLRLCSSIQTAATVGNIRGIEHMVSVEDMDAIECLPIMEELDLEPTVEEVEKANERALLAAKIKDVYELINIVQSNIQGKAVTYKSVDTVEEADEAVNYPTEFLHSLDLPGIPSHVHQLKIGVPIIMLRNINQPKLCHATRFAVKKINNVVEATILTGSFTGEDVLIPRIPMIPTDMPYQFKRL
ncbi:uncharacterized protein [Procambarus clarkii]|uniref:uncharacterized protein n=1 Tax=Procambarus clarkii TaxID=6728 RepID=UPI00374293BA